MKSSGANSPVLIIGAGMAGLTCAVTLHRANIPFLLFDRGNEVGGRVRTDEVDGYRLDRGFQVLLTAYPEACRFLDYKKLDLQRCYPGSKVWFDNRFYRMWEFYLLSSKYSFVNMGNVVFQIQIAKNINNLPLTRNYMYY